MKKALIILMAVAMLFAMTSLALATDITPNTYSLNGANGIATGAKDWGEKIQGTNTYFNPITGATVTLPTYDGLGNSTHPYGTWNSPYTYGIDGYNYNDAQDYTADGTQTGVGDHKVFPVPTPFQGLFGTSVETTLTANFTSGPHGGYLTTTHRCRECHAVHRAAGKFKLMRANTRFEACDWCHGTGAGSGFNIQMDSDDAYTTEYNTGHTMGFGIQSGKWKAPDDTYPAFTPNYWLGGFSCFDCHSPHANPQRIMGYDQNGKPIESVVKLETGEVYNIGNPGHDMFTAGGNGFADASKGDGTYWAVGLGGPLPKSKPYYLAGSWLLLKDPDRELATTTETGLMPDVYSLQKAMTGSNWGKQYPDGNWYLYESPLTQDSAIGTITAGQEIPDTVDDTLKEFTGSKDYPVNKIPTDWNNPLASAVILDNTNLFGMIYPPDADGSIADSAGFGNLLGYNVRNPVCRSIMLSEFCTDCHDGNAGLHTTAAPLFSEDRALRDQTQTGTDTAGPITGNTTNWKGEYDIGYGHDTAPRHCGRAMRFNPEDSVDSGPHCRNCHKGSSGCGGCHNTDPMQDLHITTTDTALAANNGRAAVTYLFASMFDMGNQMTTVPDPYFPNWPGYNQTMGNTDTPYAGYFYPYSTYDLEKTSNGYDNQIAMALVNVGNTGTGVVGMLKNSRTVSWSDWRGSPGIATKSCSDDGLSWPHRTLGWKMLKDDLFGIDVTGSTSGGSTVIGPGETRSMEGGSLGGNKAHDIDSVCLDCHNPTIWNAGQVQTAAGHVDDPNNPNDNLNDELLLRGLP